MTEPTQADREAELVERFRAAIAAFPFIQEGVDRGDQFNAYENAENDEDDHPDDLEFYFGIGPIDRARFFLDFTGKRRADLVEAAFKLAHHAAHREASTAALKAEIIALTEPTQADRLLVADILDEVSDLLDNVGIGQVADLIRDGEYDEHETVKITAAHREASTAALKAEIIALTTYRENLREEVRERIADQAALSKRVEELEAALRLFNEMLDDPAYDLGELCEEFSTVAKAALGGDHA